MLDNLLRMPHSHVTQFLEALQKEKLPPHLVQRMRMDLDFRKAAVQTLIASYRDNPGEKFRIEVDRTKSRSQLVTEIDSRGIHVIKLEIVEALQPKTIFADAGQGYVFGNLKPIEPMDVWLIPLWQETTEKDAIALLDYMGYQSVQTEEALTFALQKRWGHEDSIVVLASKCQNFTFKAFRELCTTSGFLSFSRNGYGDAMVSLRDESHNFWAKTKFLVKKKEPRPQTEET